MIKVSGERDQVNIAKVYKVGQDHILRFWDELDYDSRKKLLAQIDEIDFQLISRLTKSLGSEARTKISRKLQCAPIIRYPKNENDLMKYGEAVKAGEEALQAGRVALLTVAGGQASRLGLDRPKGELEIGPITGKSLFQLFAEKIIAIRKRYGIQLPWYIMTSETTDKHTRDFFEEHNYFNMPRSKTVFFKQRMLPVVDRRGKILMADKDEIFMSPNGHGGSLLALEESGSLDQIEEEGSDLLFFFQVDNPLVVIADPAFIGFHVMHQADVSCKGIKKAYPLEKVGVFACVDDQVEVVEYSELTEEEQNAQDEHGELLHGFGNAAIHVFSTGFLKKVLTSEQKLPFHVSFRKVPYMDKNERHIQPRKPNAYKFETFVFDTMAYSEKTLIVEALREDEFAPIKSNTGTDTPENAKKLLIKMWGRWLAECGVNIAFDGEGDVEGKIEISPLYALDKEELARNVKAGTAFTGHLCLEP